MFGVARIRSVLAAGGFLLVTLCASPAQAIVFNWDVGEGISGTLNTALTLGAAWRMENRDPDFIAKGNLDPDVCPVRSCQGVFQGDVGPNRARINAPGSFSNNVDDGNLNYDQYDVTQSVGKLLSDLTLTYKDYGFFGRVSAFYDHTNNDFTEFHPNRIIPTTPAMGPPALSSSGRDALINIFQALGIPLPVPLPIPAAGVPTYGPGEVVENEREGGELLRQIGADVQLLDAYVFGTFPLPGERELQLKLGRQTLNWGESTVLVINSLNQINPPNVNNLFRVGFDLAEVFTPVGLLYGTFGLTESVNLEAFYQFEWKPVEIPAPGSFLSFLDLGTNNVGDRITINFGTGPEHFSDTGFPGDNTLSLLTNTTQRLLRMPDNEPEDGGQYGLALRYYADWLNNGTELAFYAMNYHSRLPYVSFYATDAGCGKREGNAQGIDAIDTLTFLIACPDLPLLHHLTGDPENAQSDALKLSSARIQLEYPEDIQLYGFSFNTSFGELAVQGEVAYRPKLPVQVDAEDLAFAAFQPTLVRCHGNDSNPTPCVGTLTSGPNSFSLLAPLGGDAVGAARAYPSYVLPYRGQRNEELAAHSYIRGWEEFKSFQFNIGGTYVYKPSGAPLGLDQVLFLFEVGAQYLPDLPGPCELPLEAPGTFTHASAGADGTGTPEGGGRVCHPRDADVRSNADGSDGLRFNPTQQLDGFPTRTSWGYRLIFVPRWESILPGISIQPLIVFADDVRGTSPGPAESFLEGRQVISWDNEIRWKEHWQFHLGYNWFRGAQPYNTLGDRDFALAYVRYSF